MKLTWIKKQPGVIASAAKQSPIKSGVSTSSFLLMRTGLVTLLLLFSFKQSIAQNGVSSEQIEVVKAYQPLLADAVMIQFSATLPAPDTSKPQLTYDVPDRVINVPYSPALLKPIAIPKEKTDTSSSNYAKIGIGTQWTPSLDVSLNNGVNGNENYGLNLYHINQSGNLFAQDYSVNKIQGYYSAFLGGAKFSADAGFNRNVYYFYGATDAPIPVIRQEDIQQTFSQPYLNAEMQNEKNNSANFNYDIKLNGFAYFDRYGSSELNGYVEADLEKTIMDVHHINLDIFATTDAYKDSSKQTNSILSFTPFYNYKTSAVDITAGLNGSILNKQFIILPHFNSQTKIISDYLVYYAGWTGWIQQNNLLNLTTENPFINENPIFQYSQVQNSYTGFKGSVGSHFTYDGRYSYVQYYNLPLFVTDSTQINRFNIVYDRRTSINELHAELGYNVNEHFNVTYTLEYFEYNLENEAQAWGMPSFVTTLGLNYNIGDKIYLKADIFTRDRTFDMIDYETIRINGAFDANLSATYVYSQYFNFFIDLNNITAQRYYIWYDYPSYGINVLVGVDMKF
jgi:hypothetical protein